MQLSRAAIEAMIEGMQRVKRVPEKEWLEPIILRLERLQPGEKLTIERMPPPWEPMVDVVS